MINLVETTRIKEAIEQNPENYKSIIEDTDLGICITDKFGNFWDVNENYCKIYGYTKDEIVGQSFLLVVPDATKNELKDLHDKFIEIQIELFRTWEVQRKDGLVIQISVDAGYTEKINGESQKLTFVSPL
jgi:PAS domain S-box-containing protein